MEHIKLDLVPKFVPPICHASQYDKGRVICCHITYDGEDYIINSNDLISVYVRKLDGKLVTADCNFTVGESSVTFTTTEQMTAIVGENLAELKIINGTNTIGTINFVLKVEVDPTDGAIESEEELANLQTLVDNAMANETLEDIGNVNVTSPSDGDALVWDDANSQWVNGAGGGGGSSTLAGLSDVNVDTPPSDGDALIYDSTTGKWVNGSGGGGSGGHTILDNDGTSLTQRSNLQFRGAYSEDNSTDNTTEVNVVRSMTKAEFDLLSDDEKTGIINVTDDTSGGLKYVKTVLWENIDEDNMTILTDGDTITLLDNILDYDEVYFEACYIEPDNDTGKKIGHLASTKVLNNTIQLAKSKYGTKTFEGVFDVGLNYVYYSGNYSFNYSLKIPTDNSLYVAKKFAVGWGANKCTFTRIIGIKYLSDSERTYSTDEQIVGTWIDGKTLYEKSIYIDNVSFPGGWSTVAQITGIDTFIDGSQNLKDTTNGYDYSNLPMVYAHSNGNIRVFNNLGGNMGYLTGYITVRYTKSST